mmetsp:Transcript_60256/g.68653  ORF Transcript_60256/g.68653 Transcript_60256/m.68653 type:complete len:338 (+) Transcript_60256:31-1044(+)
MSLPEPLKSLKPIMLRSMEMEKLDPMVSYHCKLYILEKSISTMQGMQKTDPQYSNVKNFVVSQMGDLETAKAGLDLTNAKDHMEMFCTAIFVNVDKEDRKGTITRKTAVSFNSCSHFIETLGVFGELEPDWEEKRKYCKWKAVDISRAFKEGREPKRGGPNEEVADPEDDLINQLDSLTPATTLGGSGGSGTTNESTENKNMDIDNSITPGGTSTFTTPTGGDNTTPTTSTTTTTPGNPSNTTTTTSSITPGGVSTHEETKKNEVKPTTTTNTTTASGAGKPGAALSSTGSYNPSYKERSEASKMCTYAVSELQFNNVDQAKANVLKAWNLLNGIKD